jgi:hypothetical protein
LKKYDPYPVCLFVYNRLKEIKRTIDALQLNYLATETDLYIFVDGPKNSNDEFKVAEVRKYINSVNGFRTVYVKENERNLGLSNSVILGVSQVIENRGAVIVIEDDLVTQPTFLTYMNDALRFYAFNDTVATICGFSHDLPELDSFEEDIYFGYRPSSWGWGTWDKYWFEMIWEQTYYKEIMYNPVNWIRLLKGGSDLPQMLINQLRGKIDSWSIRWTTFQMLSNKIAVFPRKSLVLNIGFGEFATNTKRSLRFTTCLDQTNKVDFKFLESLYIDKTIMRSFRKKYSILARFRDKFI